MPRLNSNANKTLASISIAIVIVVALLLWYKYRPSVFNWEETNYTEQGYGKSNNQPYGAQIFSNILQSTFSDYGFKVIKTNLHKYLSKLDEQGAIYVFSGEELDTDSVSTVALLEFIKKGNTAFIISKSIPDMLVDTVFGRACQLESDQIYQEQYLDQATMSLRYVADTTAAYVCQYAIKNEPNRYHWQHLNTNLFCSSGTHQALGLFDQQFVNFAAFNYGNGRLLLHTNPLAFSNYNLLKPNAKAYITQVLSTLRPGNIYWDEISRNFNTPEEEGPTSESADGPHLLAHILEQRGLAWAWYILVGLALIWVVVKSRRVQRIIPVLAKKENASKEFIDTIAHLHFKAGNHRGMFIQKMKLFHARIRERYGILPPLPEPGTGYPVVTPDYAKRLALLSQLNEVDIMTIFEKYKNALHYEPNQDMLEDFHISIETFFQKAR